MAKFPDKFQMSVIINYLNTPGGRKTAEILDSSEQIAKAEDILDIMADVRYNESDSIIIHSKNLKPDFFDLKTGIAGEILQKFSNYRMRLAIVGDFSQVKSRSLKDFIRESNCRRTICFVESVDEALQRFDK